jgi:hypothetical protein
MKFVVADFNSADTFIASDQQLQSSWNELESVLDGMPLHTKDSDQKGIQGQHVFDPVGTNEHIKSAMKRLGWGCNVPIPEGYTCFGSGVDFKNGDLLVEVQFANYPFLLNNVARSDLFIRELLWAKAVVIITKCNLLPGANSMLYFEQAKNQLAKLGLFRSPIRLVGLSVDEDEVDGVWTKYRGGYYSRDAAQQRQVRYQTAVAKSKMKLHEVGRGPNTIMPSSTLWDM